MTLDEERWAEALAIARMCGSEVPQWIAERIRILALAGDEEGVASLRKIAARYDRLMAAPVQ